MQFMGKEQFVFILILLWPPSKKKTRSEISWSFSNEDSLLKKAFFTELSGTASN